MPLKIIERQNLIHQVFKIPERTSIYRGMFREEGNCDFYDDPTARPGDTVMVMDVENCRSPGMECIYISCPSQGRHPRHVIPTGSFTIYMNEAVFNALNIKSTSRIPYPDHILKLRRRFKMKKMKVPVSRSNGSRSVTIEVYDSRIGMEGDDNY